MLEKKYFIFVWNWRFYHWYFDLKMSIHYLHIYENIYENRRTAVMEVNVSVLQSYKYVYNKQTQRKLSH